MNATLPRDRALPHLPVALDAEAMAGVFGASLPGIEVRGCKVGRVRYRPGRDCSIAYRLMLHDVERDRDLVQWVDARLSTAGHSARGHRELMVRATRRLGTGAPLLHVPALDMLVNLATSDARLDALRLLDEGGALPPEAVDRLVEAVAGPRGRGDVRSATLVRYVADQRACARVLLDVWHDGAKVPIGETFYVKADVDRRGATAHEVLKSLRGSPAQAEGRLHTPVSVLWDGATGLHWERALPGRPLPDVDPQVGMAASARVGSLLAALHAAPAPAARTVSPDELCRQPREAARWLAGVEPDWTPVLLRLARRLDFGDAGLDALPAATLHGDLHPHSVLVDGDRYAFTGLDDVRRGPPVLELGAWVADAFARAVLDGREPGSALPACRAFLAAHAADWGGPVDEALLARATAHALLCTQSYGGVVNLEPARFHAVPALLDVADTVARAGRIDAVHALRAAATLETCHGGVAAAGRRAAIAPSA